MSNWHTRVYRDGVLSAKHFPISEVSEQLADGRSTVWVDLCDPTAEQLAEVAEEFGLHELAIENVQEQQRPKLDRYDTHLFLASYSVRLDAEQGELSEHKIAAFIGARWLITVRQSDGFDFARVLERWDRSPALAVHGVSYLVYGLLDVIVDSYFETINDFDDFYDEISDGIFADQPLGPTQQRHWFSMRRALVRFHRLVGPTREAISSLMRREQSAVAEDLYPYFQDVYDHVLRATEATDSLRDLVSTIVETNLSLRDYRQNLIVKKVSSWAAIITVPAMITGYFGMNVPYPGTGTFTGVVVSGVLLLGSAVGMYVLFRRKDWL